LINKRVIAVREPVEDCRIGKKLAPGLESSGEKSGGFK
jgi:hypothetical protein